MNKKVHAGMQEGLTDPVHLHFGLVAFGVCSVLQALGRGDKGCLLAVLT